MPHPRADFVNSRRSSSALAIVDATKEGLRERWYESMDDWT